MNRYLSRFLISFGIFIVGINALAINATDVENMISMTRVDHDHQLVKVQNMQKEPLKVFFFLRNSVNETFFPLLELINLKDSSAKTLNSGDETDYDFKRINTTDYLAIIFKTNSQHFQCDVYKHWLWKNWTKSCRETNK